MKKKSSPAGLVAIAQFCSHGLCCHSSAKGLCRTLLAALGISGYEAAEAATELPSHTYEKHIKPARIKGTL